MLVLVAGVYFVYTARVAPVAQKDFFECGANNTLVACPVGETPEAKTHGDCRAVGDGDTTLDDGVCS
jgi:hypothetical protein